MPVFESVRPPVVTLPLTVRVVAGATSRVPVPERSRPLLRAMDAVVRSVPPRTMSLAVSPSCVSEPIERVPALMVTFPTKEFVPPRMRVPAPALVRPFAAPVMSELMVAVTAESVEMVLSGAVAPARFKAVPPEMVEPSVPVAKVRPLFAVTVPERVTVAGEVLKMAALVLSHATPAPSASVADQSVPPVFAQVPVPPRVVSPPSQ